MTRQVPYEAFRKDLDKYWNNAARKPVRIKHSKGTRVLLSEEEYEGLKETSLLLRSPTNVSRLRSAIAQAEAGKLKEYELDE
jgi:PHD/YefM family antitoxin component YafN of YafNO toxin-antitoxin module